MKGIRALVLQDLPHVFPSKSFQVRIYYYYNPSIRHTLNTLYVIFLLSVVRSIHLYMYAIYIYIKLR